MEEIRTKCEYCSVWLHNPIEIKSGSHEGCKSALDGYEPPKLEVDEVKYNGVSVIHPVIWESIFLRELQGEYLARMFIPVARGGEWPGWTRREKIWWKIRKWFWRKPKWIIWGIPKKIVLDLSRKLLDGYHWLKNEARCSSCSDYKWRKAVWVKRNNDIGSRYRYIRRKLIWKHRYFECPSCEEYDGYW